MMRRGNRWGGLAGAAAHNVFVSRRCLIVREPVVELDGTESLDHVVAILREGRFVTARERISDTHSVYIGVQQMLTAELPIRAVEDYVSLIPQRIALLSRVLLKRDLWHYADYADKITNDTYGEHNQYFDSYQWSQSLWKEFEQYVDEWFPTGEHTHLTYGEYKQLMRYFHYKKTGVAFPKLLPRFIRLHPSFGVPVPQAQMTALWGLYKTWLERFQRPLTLRKALVINGGCGLGGLITRSVVPLVRVIDSQATAIESARADTTALGKRFGDVSFGVSDIDNECSKDRRFHAVTYFPTGLTDITCVDPESAAFRVSTKLANDELEALFAKANRLMHEDGGVLVIATTNLHTLLNPLQPHPIEAEIKHNRRWVLLDYYDVGVRTLAPNPTVGARLPRCVSDNLRCELWVLHRVEHLHRYGWIHGIPGCHPPASAAQWRSGSFWRQRTRAIREQVEAMGEDWGTYKTRLINMLRSDSAEPDDDVSQALRMALDPEYGTTLALEARDNVRAAREREQAFHRRVMEEYGSGESPREAFDRWSASFESSGGRSPAAQAAPAAVSEQHLPPSNPPGSARRRPPLQRSS